MADPFQLPSVPGINMMPTAAPGMPSVPSASNLPMNPSAAPFGFGGGGDDQGAPRSMAAWTGMTPWSSWMPFRQEAETPGAADRDANGNLSQDYMRSRLWGMASPFQNRMAGWQDDLGKALTGQSMPSGSGVGGYFSNLGSAIMKRPLPWGTDTTMASIPSGIGKVTGMLTNAFGGGPSTT